MSDDFRVIGKRFPKTEAPRKSTGQSKYADDLKLPHMLYGKLLRSTATHALVRSVDTREAEELEGVRAVITGKDLPVKYGILPVSQDETALAAEKVRYAGEPVAAVAAVDPRIAEEALELIRVDYESISPVMTIDEALEEGAHPIHGQGRNTNIHKSVSLEFGDVREGFAEADYTREDTFFYGGNTHAALEEHSALASFSADGKLVLWSSTQIPHYLHRTIASVLGLNPNRVRIIAPEVGGGFGGKTDIFSHEIVASKLSMITGQPVKITCGRDEVFYLHRGRHPALMWLKTGFKRDGAITAMHMKAALDGGAYGSYGVASLYYVGALQTATYQIPKYKFEGVRVFTNKPPCGPKRGHGTPQPRFAVECQLDKAAEELGLDPVTLRLRNAVKPYSTTVNQLRITSCGLRECVEKALEASAFARKHRRMEGGRGVGFAVSSYLSGAALPIYWNDMPHSSAQIRADRGGGVTLYCMATDIGQGSTSVLASIAAEVLGLDVQDIATVTADTDLTPVDLGSYSSRVTFMVGNAVLQAASGLRQLVFDAVAAELGVPSDSLVAKDHRIVSRDKKDEVDWTRAVGMAEARFGTLVSSGSYKPPELAGRYKGSGVGPSPAYSYSACVAEVSCDAETGEVHVESVWLAHDVGRAINPLLVEGQIEGSVVMALGEALLEEQTFRDGLVKSPSLLSYKVPTVLEMPEIHPIIVETIDPEGPFGAKEVGQGPLLPVLPAIANAVYDALKVRIDEVPITPDKVLKALKDKQAGGSGRVGPAGFPKVAFQEPEKVEVVQTQ